ncbi:3-dehydroquinate synthase [Cesiribacter sp. SM1]|uniref:3-dehydroquinate synthase n=1 Tax=Cesiribacter sp. SM1 TaxID=2861196 RepID=UPI001CD46F5E|nr:3-dehydroquinate synthase [Cesiribacter sp. SM1]
MRRVLQQTFSVPFQYQVLFTEGLFKEDNPLLARLLKGQNPAKVLFVIDDGVAAAHPYLQQQIEAYAAYHTDSFAFHAAQLLVPGGEEVKNNSKPLQAILDAVNRWGIDRHSYIICIGGGAVLDMAGFAAAVAHRGIRFVRVPTTVLAQNDSGVGVKNSINAFGKKNFLGTFAPPFAVINDSSFLTTLHERDWRAGIAEAIKVALIKDKAFFEQIEKDVPLLVARHMPAMEEQIYRCAQLHLEHIGHGGDPFEQGSSRPLDFGHWAAHKLEQLTNFRLRHGEAVAIGIALDVTYSYLQHMIPQADLLRILNLIRGLGFDLYVPELSSQEVLQGLREFQEHLGGRLTIMLLNEIGRGIEVHEMDAAKVTAAASMLKEFQETQMPA